MNVLPATVEDMETFYGFRHRRTVRAFAFVEDGDVQGIVGMCVNTRPLVGFLTLREDLRERLSRYPRPLIRVVQRLQQHAASLGLPIVVEADAAVPQADRFIVAMGFENKNGVYVWN